MSDPDMRENYDFSQGVRGKYTGRFGEGTNLVRLDRDIESLFGEFGEGAGAV